MQIALLALVLCAQPSEVPAVVKETPKPSMAEYMHKVAMSHRKANGLQEQQLDAECTKVAQDWAMHMASVNSMYHGGGEQIIAMGQPTPESAMQAWMNSSGHRFWLLSGTTRCGWGCARASNGTMFWAGCFRGQRVATAIQASTINQDQQQFSRRGFRGRRR